MCLVKYSLVINMTQWFILDCEHCSFGRLALAKSTHVCGLKKWPPIWDITISLGLWIQAFVSLVLLVKYVFVKTCLILFGLVVSTGIHVVTFSETTLNGFSVMALNPNPNGEYEWNFLFQEHQDSIFRLFLRSCYGPLTYKHGCSHLADIHWFCNLHFEPVTLTLLFFFLN